MELELTPEQVRRLTAFAAARYPKTPSGGLYIGKAASIVYQYGERWIREVLDGELEPRIEEITEPEAREAGLRLISRHPAPPARSTRRRRGP